MISFIIPTFNEEKEIENTLKRLAEYHSEHEIIVSDGGSTDRTVEIARKYADKVIIYDGKERQTIGGGRNAGAAAAQWELLVFLDADVSIFDLDEFFERAMQVFQSDEYTVAVTAHLGVLPELETRADKIFFGISNFLVFLINNVLRIGGSPGEFMMVRTSAFKEVEGFDEKVVVAEDQDFFRRLAKIGKTRYVGNLHVYHTGRRAHKIGWPRLLYEWFINYFYGVFFGRSASKEWNVIR
jgi:GT2 family glycosyltransferase